MRQTALALSLLLTPAGAVAGDSPHPPTSLVAFVRAWVAQRERSSSPASTDTMIARPAALGGARDQWLVYLTGGGWCGSGGCSLLVLEPRGGGWVFIGRTTITRAPIVRLATIHHGYHDLGVGVGGGGILRPYTAGLPFDWKRYASNPTIPPAYRVAPQVDVGKGADAIINRDAPATPLP
jgi:hypothetical protein